MQFSDESHVLQFCVSRLSWAWYPVDVSTLFCYSFFRTYYMQRHQFDVSTQTEDTDTQADTTPMEIKPTVLDDEHKDKKRKISN